MTCPYRYWNIITNSWVCELVYQDCSEGYLDGFDYKYCSTYEKHEKELKTNKKERKELIDMFIEYLHIVAKREMTIYEVIKKFEKM